MRIDPGLVVIVGAVLAFYLRLIILQRQRAKQAAYQPKPSGKKKKQPPQPPPIVRYSIISDNKRDWIIAGAGILLVFLGIMLNLKVIPIPLAQTYWYIPVALGIVAFSWGFK